VKIAENDGVAAGRGEEIQNESAGAGPITPQHLASACMCSCFPPAPPWRARSPHRPARRSPVSAWHMVRTCACA